MRLRIQCDTAGLDVRAEFLFDENFWKTIDGYFG